MVNETADHTKLFDTMYVYETAIYKISNFTMPENQANLWLNLNNSGLVEFPQTDLVAVETKRLRDRYQCEKVRGGLYVKANTCEFTYYLESVCFKILVNGTFAQCRYMHQPQTRYIHQGYGTYRHYSDDDFKKINKSQLQEVTIVAIHEKDPIFLALELTDSTFSFITHPWVFFVAGVTALLIGITCTGCIVQSCYNLQVKEAQRAKELRRQKYIEEVEDEQYNRVMS